jgi:hypothetical protein
MKGSGGVMLLGVFIIALALVMPTFAILNVSNSNISNITDSFSPVQGPQAHCETFFDNMYTTIHGTAFSYTFNLGTIGLTGSSYRYLEFQVPLGGFHKSSTEYGLNIGWVNLHVTVNGNIVYNCNVNINQTAIYKSITCKEAYVGFNFILNNNTYGITKFTLTANYNYGLDSYCVHGNFASITGYKGVYFNEGFQPASAVNIGYNWYYNTEQVNISNLLTSKMVKFSLVWNSTVPICLTYNGTTKKGSSGIFANSLPTSTSITGILPVSQFKAPNGYTVTFSLTDVEIQGEYSKLTNVGNFYIEVGNTWEQINKTSVINLNILTFPSHINFAYVEDNGTTGGMTGAYITFGNSSLSVNYTMNLNSPTTINGFTAYEISIPVSSTGSYQVNGYLNSVNDTVPVLIMSIVMPTSGTISTVNSNSASLSLNVNQEVTIAIGVLIFAVGLIMYWKRW